MNINIKSLFCIFCLSTVISASAQKNTNDPFSSFGIGTETDGYHPVYQATGNTYASHNDSLSVNYFNPSTYSSIAKGQPIFSIGINTSLIESVENGNKENGNLTQISHFSFGISFAKILGFSFGIRPFTTTGYHVNTLQPLDENITMRHRYDGEGNTNLFYGGFSVNALNLKHHRIGVGFNMGYLFGSTQNNQLSYLEEEAPTHKGTMYSTTHFLNSFYYDLGVNYQFLLDNDRLTVGATFRPQQKLSGKYISEKAYTTNVENMENYSFIESNVRAGKITLPQKYTVGVQYQLLTKRNRQNTKLNSKLSISAQYGNTQWSRYQERFDSIPTIGYSYKNTHTFSFGIEYIPQHLFMERVETGYLSKVRYRIGSSFSNLPFRNGNNVYTAQSYSVGFGFPFLILRSTSSINFAVSYNRQFDAGQTSSFQKNFFNFSLGISFAPGINDRWFRKYKID